MSAHKPRLDGYTTRRLDDGAIRVLTDDGHLVLDVAPDKADALALALVQAAPFPQPADLVCVDTWDGGLRFYRPRQFDVNLRPDVAEAMGLTLLRAAADARFYRPRRGGS